MADEPTPTRRVELIDQGGQAADGLPGYIGVGLIGGIVLGFGPLRDAIQGVGPFEDAMLRFLACLLVCVVAASFIGRILDSAPSAEEEIGAGTGTDTGTDTDPDEFDGEASGGSGSGGAGDTATGAR